MNARIHRCLSLFIACVIIALLGVALGGCSREAKTARALKRADEYFRKGQFKEAKIEYGNVLKLDPKNAGAIKNLGVIWSEQGVPLRALPYLLRTMEDAPKDLDTCTRVATAFLALDSRGDAANVAAAILTERADHERALLLLADAARLPGEIKQVRERLDHFPNKEAAAYHLANGSLLIKSGETKKGEGALKEAERLAPNDPLPRLALANVALGRKDIEEAGKQFAAASELANPRSLTSLAHAEFLRQCNRSKEAGDALKPVLAAAPDYLPALRLQAQVSFALGDKAAANKHLQELFRLDSENLEGAILQARIWTTDGETKKAEDLLERLNGKFPKYPTIRFELARCANASGNSDRAIQILDELVRSNPDYAQAVLVLNELRLRKGDARAAVVALESFCNQRKAYPPAEIMLAQAYRAVGRQPEAIAIYQRWLQETNSRQGLHFLIGLAMREMKRDDEAIASFEAAAKADPKSFEPLVRMIDIDLERKDFGSALKRLTDRGGEGGQSAELLFLKGKIEVAQAQWTAAEKSLLEAGRMNPLLTGVYELLLRTYIATGRLKEACQQAEALCARQPNDIGALTTLAKIKNQLGDQHAAAAAYEKVLALKPDSATALNNLACVYLEQPNQVEKAYGLARRARELQPDNAAFADTLGWASFKRREYGQALALLQESASEFSGNSEVMYHLGMACYMMGRVEPAIDALEKAAALPGEYSGKSEIPARLALLGKGVLPDVATLTRIGKDSPGDVYVWYRLGEVLREARDFGGAALAFQKGVDANPQMLSCLVELAALNAGPLNRREAAAEQIKQASKLASGDPASCAIVGRMAYQLHDWAHAYQLLTEASRSPVEKAKVVFALARAAYAHGKTSEAVELLSELEGQGSVEQRAEAQRLVQLVKLSEGTVEPGGESVTELLQKEPDDPLALMASGAIERARKKIPEAKAHFIRVLQLVPEFPLAQKQLAAIYVEDPQQRAKAHELAVKARRALPADSELALILAESSFHRKEYAYARQLFEERAKVQPLGPCALYMLGVSCWEQKNRDAAAAALGKAMDSGISEPMRSDAERILKVINEDAVAAKKTGNG